MSNNFDIKNRFTIFRKMVGYNLKIIFANKFIWFLLAAFAFFVFFAVQTILNGGNISEGTLYNLLIFPGILLIFYPSVFGIQNDDDSRMLEILFGIPNYRYKVWLVRLIMIYVLIFIIIIVFAAVASVLLYKINILEMSYQLMYPIVFLGSMAFMFSTLIKNGNGTAVVMILIGVALLILKEDVFERTQWDIFLNPFQIPNNLNEVIWLGLISKNRIFLGIGILVFILYGLFNLQKREKFI
ncbi:MAG: hypothetical protein HN778_09335 [Prolixibacteraceae bacterium]|jgi:hypothetical protein|nr:hypothetical protein [Prolixibacteraceae bacterium]MBT6007588.1 hypothetical protein [Prolixibacteraceae bacterium]MBT6767044.1 hypothetical protein [Prolixibacteraceae bacterium]MBT7395020.1 hypothetical protein [Prolixibacteraceae bacterium]